MEFINVLIKGVEVKDITFCKGFLTEASANEWIDAICIKNDWLQKSQMGWNEANDMNDVRVEDLKGNTYYFVLYRQELI